MKKTIFNKSTFSLLFGILTGAILPIVTGYIYLVYVMGISNFNVPLLKLEAIFPDILKLSMLVNLIPFWVAQIIFKDYDFIKGILMSTIGYGLYFAYLII